MAIINHFAWHVRNAEPGKEVPPLSISPAPGAIAQSGIVLPIVVSAPRRGRPEDGGQNAPAILIHALLDTGATRTSIDSRVASELGLGPVGFSEIGTAAGKRTMPNFVVDISFPNTGMRPRQMLHVGSCDLSYSPEVGTTRQQNIGALIGRDILANWVVVWNGAASTVTICD